MLSNKEIVFKEALIRAGLADCLTRFASSGWLLCLEAEIAPMKPWGKLESSSTLWGDIAYELDEKLGPVPIMKRQTAQLGPEWLPIADEKQSQELPFDFVKCFNCSFGAHTNPPAHFTEKDVGFCCSRCRMDGRHGGQCQKRLV